MIIYAGLFRLEGSISNIERTRESSIKRYRDFQIPWQWILDGGLIGQVGGCGLWGGKGNGNYTTPGKKLNLRKERNKSQTLFFAFVILFHIHCTAKQTCFSMMIAKNIFCASQP